MKKIIKQAINFFCVSGVGWIIDFLIFILLTHIGISEVIANIVSSFFAITFVYLVSTDKIFKNINKNLNLKKKFILYILYQIIVVSVFSVFIGLITKYINNNIDMEIVLKYSQLIAKILVTPITMLLNFAFMKFLIERV